jgi:hypothetical protein
VCSSTQPPLPTLELPLPKGAANKKAPGGATGGYNVPKGATTTDETPPPTTTPDTGPTPNLPTPPTPPNVPDIPSIHLPNLKLGLR